MLFKNSVRTSKKTPHFTITSINFVTLFKGIIAVYSELYGGGKRLVDVMTFDITYYENMNFLVLVGLIRAARNPQEKILKALVVLKFRRVGKHFYGTKRL
jgi:hypothetical protein